MTTRDRLERLFTVLALVAGAATAHAGGVVGNGTPASCTPAALVQALAGGGTVTFACGAAPHTIVLPARQTIAADTTIDGGDRITLSGGGAHGHFTVQTGRSLMLENLALGDGAVENWAVFVSDDASLEAYGVTVQSCLRGGIYNAGGVVMVADSTFAGNDAGSGGSAITNEGGGHLTIERSAFSGNLNGAIFATGPTTITDSLFSDNRGRSGGGGAIQHSAGMEVVRCRFDDNQASAGGAIYAQGHLLVEDSLFRRNVATLFEGGAIQLYNQTQSPSSVTVRRSTFDENEAVRAAGGVRCDAPNGTCTLENVTFSRNAAVQNGTGSDLSLKSGTLRATHLTILAGGTPAVERVAGTFELQNSIVAGGACSGAISNGGGNLQSVPGLCSGFTTGDPALFALIDNGGLTPTHELGTTSAALGLAATNCLATDQRGVERPTTACDAGAFQRGAKPILTALVPSRATAGGPAFTMIVEGASFLAAPKTRVLWNGAALDVEVTSPTELRVAVPAALIAAAGVATVTIENPNPPVPDGGPAATSLPFTIDDETTPPPPPPPPPPAGPCDGLEGYDAVLCALQQARLPGHFCADVDLDPKLQKPMLAAFSKTATFVTSARDASAKKQVRFLKKARAQLTKLAKKAGKKSAGRTTPDCKTAVVDGTNALATDVAGLAL